MVYDIYLNSNRCDDCLYEEFEGTLSELIKYFNRNFNDVEVSTRVCGINGQYMSCPSLESTVLDEDGGFWTYWVILFPSKAE